MDNQNPHPRQCWTFSFFIGWRQREASDPVLWGPPLRNSGISDELFFLRQNQIILRGKKCTALFQTYSWEKSIFFNALEPVFAQIFANTCQGGHICPPPLGLIGLKKGMCHIVLFECNIFLFFTNLFFLFYGTLQKGLFFDQLRKVGSF